MRFSHVTSNEPAWNPCFQLKKSHWEINATEYMTLVWTNISSSISLCFVLNCAANILKQMFHSWKLSNLNTLTRFGLATLYGEYIWYNRHLGNTPLPDDTKPLPDPMLVYHQWIPLKFTRGQFQSKCLRHQLVEYTAHSKLPPYLAGTMLTILLIAFRLPATDPQSRDEINLVYLLMQ